MMNSFIQFAVTESASHSEAGIFTQLGIDWKMLILQLVAFLILLAVLRKFVYPPLMKVVDDRQKQIEDSRKLAEEVKAQAESTEDEVAKMMKEARREASAIVATARDEAGAAVADAETKAQERAESIVRQAREQIDKDIKKAREALQKDTLELVALATEKVVGAEVRGKIGDKVIERAVSEAKS